MIDAKIVKDSIGPSGVRLTTFVLTYPRFIHAEFMTHRVFSRNASSSRAIPVKKQIEEVEKNPAIPLAFRKNQKGMQAGELLENQEEAVNAWLSARNYAVIWAKTMADMDIHKQYANRILEPFSHITVVCTATDYDNFFALRIHPAAQPEICELASQMFEQYKNSVPEKLQNGQWHLPFIDKDTIEDSNSFLVPVRSTNELNDLLVKRSVARCARVSYKNHDGTRSTVDQDLELYERLLGGVPIHASPSEHQAMAIADANIRSGNLRGWIQYRKTLKDENIKVFNGFLTE